MKLFITKNPKSWGSFGGTSLVVLKDRTSNDLVGVVWTTENLSHNRFGGTNHWQCSYIQFEDGYGLSTKEDKAIVRLWNKEQPVQPLVAPMYNGVAEEAYIINRQHKYVDVYAEVAPHWMYHEAAFKTEDLFYQKWDKEYVEKTILTKLEGEHLPSEEEVIVYSRRGNKVVTAYWDNIDHVMEYHMKDFDSYEETRLFCMTGGISIYSVFTEEDALWAAVEETLKAQNEPIEEAPDVEEIAHRRVRKIRRES